MTDSATCYYPDGSTAPTSYACWNSTGSSDGFAPCCFNDGYCFSNGLCLASNHMTVYRAGCTDATWKSSNCANYCTGAKIGGLYKCDDAGNAACFLSGCGTDQQFQVPSGSLLRAGPAVTSALGLVSETSASTSISSSSISSTSSSTASSSSASINPSTTPTPEAQKQSDSLSTGAAAGIGLGIGIPLLIICGILTWLLFKEKRQRRALMDTQNQSGFSQSQPDVKPAPQYSAPQYTPVHEIDHGQRIAQLP